MSEQKETFSRIEEKLGLLTSKLRDYKRENEKMRKELDDKKLQWDEMKTKNEQMELQMNMPRNGASVGAETSNLLLQKKRDRPLYCIIGRPRLNPFYHH